MSVLPRAVVCALVIGALAACGGGSSGTLGGAGVLGIGAVTPFSVTIGSGSSVTKVGIVSSIETGSPEHDIAVTPGSSGCTAAGTSLTCTAALGLPLGAQTLTVTTYGTTTVKSTVQATLKAGSRTALAVSEPIAQISLNLASPVLVGSQSGTTTLYVTARDANGNTIVGSFGGASIAITSSDTTGSVTLSPTTVTAGGTPVTVNYNGSGSVPTVSFNATSSGVPASSIIAATLAFTASTLMYVSGNDSVNVFPLGASGDPAPLQSIVVPSETFVNGGQPDGHGHLWVALGNQVLPTGVFGSRTLGYVPVSANGPVTPTYVSSTAFPANSVVNDFGIDSAGNVYALVSEVGGPPGVMVFTPGSSTPSRIFTATGFTSSTVCGGIGVFTDGTTAIPCKVAGTPEIVVFAPGSSGTVTPSRTISGTATTLVMATPEYVFIQFGADGSLALNDADTTGNASIDVFAPGASGNAAPRRIAGTATGLNSASLTVVGSTTNAKGLTWGVGIDATGATYAAQYGSQSITNGQVLRFAPTASGNVPPESVLGGPLTGFGGAAYGPVHFSPGVAAVPTATSVTGDFLALSPNRGWNYALTTPPEGTNQTPAPPATFSLYSDPNPINGATDLVALALPSGNPATAIGASGALIAGEALFQQASDGGYISPGYLPVAGGSLLGGIIPIPGNLRLTTGTLTVGQNIFVYPVGITGTVLSVGPVPGASACPGGATTGAIVAYVLVPGTETVGYVPGCGITYFVSDAGAAAVLTSVGSYPSIGQLSSTRTPASVENVRSLRSLWKNIFMPWKPQQ
jgi:hypothetical protein